MEYINLTPHAIRLNDGREFPTSGTVARVQANFSAIVDDVCEQVFGEIQGLPEPAEDVRYIVSGLILSALSGKRDDVVAPATGHSLCQRNDKGHIVSVPCFVR
jgi:hypothetical protein